jgi:hypothetical protein
MNPQTQNKLAATAAATYTEITNLAEDLTLPQGEYPLAQIIETLDDRICPPLPVPARQNHPTRHARMGRVPPPIPHQLQAHLRLHQPRRRRR